MGIILEPSLTLLYQWKFLESAFYTERKVFDICDYNGKIIMEIEIIRSFIFIVITFI